MTDRVYSDSGVLLGLHTIDERNAFIATKVREYDTRNPGNRKPVSWKRRRARWYWLRKVRAEIAWQRQQQRGIWHRETAKPIDSERPLPSPSNRAQRTTR